MAQDALTWHLLRCAVAGGKLCAGADSDACVFKPSPTLSLLLTSPRGSPRRRSPGVGPVKQALLLPAGLPANLSRCQTAVTWHLVPSFFHVAITYVRPRGSLSTHPGLLQMGCDTYKKSKSLFLPGLGATHVLFFFFHGEYVFTGQSCIPAGHWGDEICLTAAQGLAYGRGQAGQYIKVSSVHTACTVAPAGLVAVQRSHPQDIADLHNNTLLHK